MPLAPATECLRAPDALDAARAPILALASSEKVVTPPTQAAFLQHALGNSVPIEARVVAYAGHFSLMTELSPQMGDRSPHGNVWPARVGERIGRFVGS